MTGLGRIITRTIDYVCNNVTTPPRVEKIENRYSNPSDLRRCYQCVKDSSSKKDTDSSSKKDKEHKGKSKEQCESCGNTLHYLISVHVGISVHPGNFAKC